MAGTRKSTVHQVTIHLKSEEVEFLKTQAGIDGVSFNDVLRRSIILEKFIVDQQRKKRKIFFGAPGQPLREMIRDRHERTIASPRRGGSGAVIGAGDP